ncbi:hypothetical protein F2P56_009292, partial [Juglans regia]
PIFLSSPRFLPFLSSPPLRFSLSSFSPLPDSPSPRFFFSRSSLPSSDLERQEATNPNMESSGGDIISSIQSMRAEDEVISERRPLCYCGILSKLRTSSNPKSFIYCVIS